AGSHTRTVPALSAASSLPLGLNDTPISPPWVCSGVPTGWRVTGFHTRTVAFSSSLASSLPLGLNASPNTPTPPVWPPFWRGVPTGRRLTGFHSRTMPLVSALASSLPLGLNATTDTPPEGPDPVWRG